MVSYLKKAWFLPSFFCCVILHNFLTYLRIGKGIMKSTLKLLSFFILMTLPITVCATDCTDSTMQNYTSCTSNYSCIWSDDNGCTERCPNNSDNNGCQSYEGCGYSELGCEVCGTSQYNNGTAGECKTCATQNDGQWTWENSVSTATIVVNGTTITVNNPQSRGLVFDYEHATYGQISCPGTCPGGKYLINISNNSTPQYRCMQCGHGIYNPTTMKCPLCRISESGTFDISKLYLMIT